MKMRLSFAILICALLFALPLLWGEFKKFDNDQRASMGGTLESITGKNGKITLGNGAEMQLVAVSSGNFLMGSPDTATEANSNEKPQCLVSLSTGFHIGAHEVTQAQFEEIMGSNPSYFKHPGSGKQPVEHVNWYDAVRFCNALSKKTGLTPCYTDQNNSFMINDLDSVSCSWNASGYRLPTEAEWEYACRAGTTTKYQCGDAFDENYAWYSGNSQANYSPNSFGKGTHSVCGKHENAWQLFDMHGNLWEWCWDSYASSYSTQKEKRDPRGPASGSYRVYRGGCWSTDAWGMRSTVRNGCSPMYRNGHLGFRILRIAH